MLWGFRLIVTKLFVYLSVLFVSNLYSASFLSYFSPDFKFNPRHYVNNTDMFIRCQNSLPFTLAGLLPSPLLSPSSFSPSLPQPIPLSSPMAVSRQTQSQCAPDAPPPPTPPHPHSLSLLTLCSIQTDGIAISPGFSRCLSHCLPQSTLSILSSSFLSLTKWKISRERENEWKEKERERRSLCSQHVGPSPGFSWATFSVMFCPCRTLGCLHFYEMWFSWLHTASRRPRWNR